MVTSSKYLKNKKNFPTDPIQASRVSFVGHTAHFCATESEHQVLNGSRIFISFARILVLFGTKFQYSLKMRQDEERKQSDKAAIRELVRTFCPTMRNREN